MTYNKKVVLIVVILAALATGAGWFFMNRDINSPVANLMPPPDKAKVASIVDGITIKTDTGHIVRYLGVRVPTAKEKVECFSKEIVMANESVIGKEIRMEEDPLLKRSNDGAWVRYVFFKDDTETDVTKPSPTPSTTPSETPSSSPLSGGESAGTTLQSPASTPTPTPTPEPKEVFVNERILEGGFGFPLLSKDMKYGERMMAASRYASATKKGLWGKCEIEENEQKQIITKPVTDCVIKGKVLENGKKIFRGPECKAYGETMVLPSQGGMWFCADDNARDAGFEKAPDCPQEKQSLDTAG